VPTTRIFLASSSAAKNQANTVIKAFSSSTLEFLPWWDAFTAGRTLLSELDAIKQQVDGALIIMSPEISATVRGNAVALPNQNVLFEFGYFFGFLGSQKVGVMKYGEVYLPSDLGGYIHISGSTFFQPNRVVQVGSKTNREFGKWIAQL
jgi:CRP/FNR family cyclic AMP-dependent transcriptional regulator